MKATRLKVERLVLAALFAALSCAATMVIQIPSPMSGYVNLGDCFVLLSGVFLGPVWGFLAAGTGSMMADILTGYAHYAPGTFLIKGLMALVLCMIFRAMCTEKLHRSAAYLIAAVPAELLMIVGYFLYACLLLGKGPAAAASIPGNIMQGIFGVFSSFLLLKMLERVKFFKNLLCPRSGDSPNLK